MKPLLISLAGILLFLQFQLWVGEGSVAALHRLRDDVAQRRISNEELAERNRSLEKEVLALKEGLDAIEERARTDLGMIRDDETFYLFIE